MRKSWLLLAMVLVTLGLLALSGTGRVQGQKTLDVYYLDMEGGGGTLIVSPSGQSMLIDAGNPGGRDSERIIAAVTQAELKHIDYFLATHYHNDHIGDLAAVAAKIPIRNFIDHGQPMESMEGPGGDAYRKYLPERAKGKHLLVKPGDKIPIAGLDVTVVSAGGKVLTKPLSGVEPPNANCGDFMPREERYAGDAGSVGIVIGYNQFFTMQLGDLTRNKEYALVCPNKMLGTVEVFQLSVHGLPLSSPKAFVHALRPRVVVINNAATKGASIETMRIVKASPGLEDVWQLHKSELRPPRDILLETEGQGGAEANPPENFIANLDESTAHFIKMTVRPDGSFVMTNRRNGFTKEYKPRR